MLHRCFISVKIKKHEFFDYVFLISYLFLIFVGIMKIKKESVIKNIGLIAVYIGVLFMAISFFAGWTTHNWVTLSCLMLIIAGVVFHIIMEKRQSKY